MFWIILDPKKSLNLQERFCSKNSKTTSVWTWYGGYLQLVKCFCILNFSLRNQFSNPLEVHKLKPCKEAHEWAIHERIKADIAIIYLM